MEKQLGRLDQKLTSVDMRGRDTNNRRVFVFVDAALFCPEKCHKVPRFGEDRAECIRGQGAGTHEVSSPPLG
jgi:biotin carboxylase